MQEFVIRRFPFSEEACRIANGMTMQRRGYCVIAINSKAPEEQQAATLRHELSHIALNHFFDRRSEDELEEEANRYAASMTEEDFRDLMRYELKWKGRICGRKKGAGK